jgi:hypothetical protein
MNIFEQASRLSLTFATPLGTLRTDDLWSLPLTSNKGTSLDQLAVALHNELQNKGTLSFVTDAVKPNDYTQLRFDIIKHILDIKIAERDAAAKARADREKKQKLLELISRKENQELENMPLDDLRKMVEAL